MSDQEQERQRDLRRQARLRAADDAEQFASEHERILDALEAGDAETAERLTREHITHALDLLAGRVDADGRALSDAA